MRYSVGRLRNVGLAAALIAAIAAGGCMGVGGSGPDAQPVAAAPAAPAEGEIDIRRYIGPDYCPELRIRPGTELVRNYAGAEETQTNLVWQASLGNTARECLYDLQGNLTLRVGVSGRVVSGPKGVAGTNVTLPLRIAVVRYQEAVLANELHPITIAIPPGNSAVFTEVRDVVVPAPGDDRNYVLYVGFDEKGQRLLGEPEPPPVAKAPPKPRRQAPKPARPAAQAPAAAKPSTTPNVLPTPSDGFVLSR